MKNLIPRISVSIIGMCLVMQVNAAWMTDYSGTLGTQTIGMAISTKGDSSVGEIEGITNVHYFYTKHLRDIPLKLKKTNGSNVSFEEFDDHGKLVATFNLTATKDDKLIGTWDPVDNKNHFPVHLRINDAVSTDGEGGRCELNEKNYQLLQEKISKFQSAVMKHDIKTLKNDFHFKMPKDPGFRKEVATTEPHDLFCNSQGYMYVNGLWFSPDGYVIGRRR